MEQTPLADRETSPAHEVRPGDAPVDPSTDAVCPVDHVALAAAAVAADPAAACPVDHRALAAQAAADAAASAGTVADAPVTPAPDAPAADAARCPVPHGIATLAPGCPVPHDRAPRVVHRSKADDVVRKVLRIKERPEGVSSAAAYAAFQKSMLISATRCTLTYVIFPFVLPFIGLAASGAIGIMVGTGAMTADVFTIRRFFAVDHKWRWYFSTIVFGIMCLLTALLIQDISHLAA